MNPKLKITLITAVAFVVAAGIVQNFRHQWEIEHQLGDLQKQVSHGTPAPPAASPAASEAPLPPAPIVLQNATGGYVEKQHAILQVMDTGWKLINKRTPASAAQAAAIFQDALDKIDSDSSDLYNGLGRALLIAGRPADALAAWRKGLALAPTFADIQSGIGWAYWNLHDPYHAKQAWDAAVAIDPNCADAWSALAWIDMALGNKDQSVIGFQVLVAYDSRHQPWTTGLSMARAGNRDLAQITSLFPLPPLDTFQHPPAADPPAKPATTPISAAY